MLDLGRPVVRTRVQDESIWRALQRAGVNVLVETEQRFAQIVEIDSTRREIAADLPEAVVNALRCESAAEEEGE